MKFNFLNIFRLAFSIPLISSPFFGIFAFIVAFCFFIFSDYSSQPLQYCLIIQTLGLVLGACLALSSIKSSSLSSVCSGGVILPAKGNQFVSHGFLSFAFVSIFCVVVLNFVLNSNFSTLDPSARFAHVRIPILQSLASSLLPVQIFCLYLTPVSGISFPLSSPKWRMYTFQTLLSILAASSKAVFLYYALSLYLSYSTYINPSFYVSPATLFRDLHSLRLNPRFILSIFSVILFTLPLYYLLLFRSGVSLQDLALRFASGFDQLILLSQAISQGLISPLRAVMDAGQPPFFLVWFKPFVRPFFPVLFDLRFDNYTEYLQYILLGKTTDAYSATGWAPNNSIFTDLYLFSPGLPKLQFFLAVIISFIVFRFAFGSFLFILSAKSTISVNLPVLLASASYALGPIAFAIDTQFFFTSYVLSLSFLIFLRYLYSALKTLMLYPSV